MATISDPDYTGSASGTLVIEPAAATVELTGLEYSYDGAGKAATVTTTAPAGVTVTLSYDGDAALPVNAGSYSVTATITDPNYLGAPATATPTIAQALAEYFAGRPERGVHGFRPGRGGHEQSRRSRRADRLRGRGIRAGECRPLRRGCHHR